MTTDLIATGIIAALAGVAATLLWGAVADRAEFLDELESSVEEDAEYPHCYTCVYWRTVDGLTGECRALPPTPVIDRKGRRTSEFPVTGNEEWCGEFEGANDDD